jgi:hypothetical protein
MLLNADDIARVDGTDTKTSVIGYYELYSRILADLSYVPNERESPVEPVITTRG